MAKSKKTRVKVPGLDEAVAARKRLAEAIGSFAMNFVVLENQVNHAVGVFLRIPTIKMRQLLTAAIRNTSTRLDILQSLVNGCKMTKALRINLSNCVKQIRDSNTYRNRLLHDTWTGYQPHDRSWQKVRAITDSKFRYQSKTFSPKTVAAEDRKCIRLLVRLNKLTKRYDDYRQRQETLSASRKKSV
jgi:hypothetical protein